MNTRNRMLFVPIIAALALGFAGCSAGDKPAETATSAKLAPDVTLAKARAIAKDAVIWGFPLVDDHRIQYDYFIDKSHAEYKGDWNTIGHNTRLYTPDDKTIQTINSDTLYSFIGVDVRDEPIVLSVPKVDAPRYYGVSIFDLWGHCDMLGVRTTGNEAGNFMLAGPSWHGPTPSGIKKVVRMETTLGNIAIRTQLFNAGDIENVKQVQAGYKVQTLSKFLGTPALRASPVAFIKPLTKEQQKSSLEFFHVLNNLLQFAPVHPTEVEHRQRVAKIGLTGAGEWSTSNLSPEMKTAIAQGQADAWVEINASIDRWNKGELSPSDCYGTREYLKNNYLNRTTAIVIAGNAQPKEEVIYPFIAADAAGQPLSGANRYTITYPGDQLPPAKFFWSLTMYELPSRLLVANPINRYLLNTPMQPSWVKDADGGYTFYVQSESPGADKAANWLPAPKGGFYMVMRVYGPSKEAQDGVWKAPKPVKAN